MSYKKHIAAVWQHSFTRFVIFGFITFAFDYFLYIFFLHINAPMNFSKASSSFIAVLFNYFLNSSFNFGKTHSISTRNTFQYLLLYSVLIYIHVIINGLLYKIFLNEHTAVLFAMSIAVFMNYFSVRWFFKIKNNHVL